MPPVGSMTGFKQCSVVPARLLWKVMVCGSPGYYVAGGPADAGRSKNFAVGPVARSRQTHPWRTASANVRSRQRRISAIISSICARVITSGGATIMRSPTARMISPLPKQ